VQPWIALAVLSAISLSLQCGRGPIRPPPPTSPPDDLRINEVVSQNQGVWVDEAGETDDYVELINLGAASCDIAKYALADSSHVVVLPHVNLGPNQVILLWADDRPDQGPTHLGFKISSAGERLTLLRGGAVVDQVDVPALAAHHAYQRIPDGTGPFIDCGWATPSRPNGLQCGPPPLPELPADKVYASFTWPSPWPARPQPLMLTELVLRPAGFVEVLNTSTTTVDLSQYQVRLSPHATGTPWPTLSEGCSPADSGSSLPCRRPTARCSRPRPASRAC
jgi:hypothetical protein